jgi:hypothetical protein
VSAAEPVSDAESVVPVLPHPVKSVAVIAAVSNSEMILFFIFIFLSF